MFNIICLLTRKPDKNWLDFLNDFKKYRVFIIIDDNTNNYDYLQNEYPNINIVQIDNELCDNSGYKNITFTLQKKITAWDKALYFLKKDNIEYDNVWFIEDDVFLYNEYTLLNIDDKYGEKDLLCTNIYNNIDGKSFDWHWPSLEFKIDPPYYNGMMCCIRCSKKLINEINKYVEIYNELFFLEVMFPTLCLQKNLIHISIPELETIVYRNEWLIDDIKIQNLYHPIKNKDLHTEFRLYIN